MADFPVALTNIVPGLTEIQAKHVNNLEAKIGVDGSAVVTSLDYLLRNPASVNPGHGHTWAALTDVTPTLAEINYIAGVTSGVQVNSTSTQASPVSTPVTNIASSGPQTAARKR